MSERSDHQASVWREYLASHMRTASDDLAKTDKLDTALWWAFTYGWDAAELAAELPE